MSDDIVLGESERTALKWAMGMPWFERLADPATRGAAFSDMCVRLEAVGHDEEIEELRESVHALQAHADGLQDDLVHVALALAAAVPMDPTVKAEDAYDMLKTLIAERDRLRDVAVEAREVHRLVLFWLDDPAEIPDPGPLASSLARLVFALREVDAGVKEGS